MAGDAGPLRHRGRLSHLVDTHTHTLLCALQVPARHPLQLLCNPYASVPVGRLSSFALTMDGEEAGRDFRGRSRKGAMSLGLGHTGCPERRAATFAAARVACVCMCVCLCVYVCVCGYVCMCVRAFECDRV
jgi:hypothetical protein